jgi:cell wall-associated NlpC family hydrolase
LLVAGIVTPLVLTSGTPASADQVATLKARAGYIAGEIQTANVKLAILDETYLEAKARVSLLTKRVAKSTTAIQKTQTALHQDRLHLRQMAIEDYVSGGASQNLSVIFSSTQQTAGMQQAYIQAASGNLNESETTVQINQRALSIERASLNHAKHLATANELTVSNDVAQARALSSRLTTEEANVKGQLATAVAAIQQARTAAYDAALARAAEQAAAQEASQASTTPAPTTTNSTGSYSPGDSAGEIAVQAAQGQRGVPYVWGGATPGMGFDCSGLTMWAWGQAGVSLSHGATDQYYEIRHVSMSDLEPGDLIFYGDAGLLYHVVMYIGGGMVVQAEETGTNVMDTPIPPGPYGAGRP